MKAAIMACSTSRFSTAGSDEAYEVSGGWAIGDRETYHDWMEPIHATAILLDARE
jgi:hypothetical protein